ncbi:MAG: methylmalonyl-CoA mutase [Nitrospinota bacterium]
MKETDRGHSSNTPLPGILREDPSQRKAWEEKVLKPSLSKVPERRSPFRSISGREIERLSSPLKIEGLDYLKDLGFPGEFPYTRGIYPTMYRARPWTIRQFAGFGSARDTNRRFHYLLSHGQAGLSVAFHLPTLMGVDSDSPQARGEVGRCGVAVDSLEDMEVIFEGVPLDQVTTSMTINAPAIILLAMYLVVAEKQGVSWEKVGGTIQNDILKEYIAQKTYIFPPGPSMRLILETFRFCSRHVPRFNFISVSGYHIREAGATAVQELAFTLADGLAYVEAAVEGGMEVDEFAPRISFFFNSHSDFFEEIAKLRAARRIWAREMKRRFSPKDPRSLMCRTHVQTAGCTLTAQQPENNAVRVALQALAAALGGAQSIHTNSLDETLGLPTERAVTLALRTQQIVAEESGITDVVDPLGGSYYLEGLTRELEEGALEYIERIDSMGGMVAAVEKGFPQREIIKSAYEHQRRVEAGERVVVGVNKYTTGEDHPTPILEIESAVEAEQVECLKELRARRDGPRVRGALEALTRAAAQEGELMPQILEAVRAYATIGEMISALKEVFGEYRDPADF